MNNIARRIAYFFLCLAPLLIGIFTGIRDLRIPGVYQTLGVVVFLLIGISAWILGARAMTAGAEDQRRYALSGILLLAPWTAISLLWVGLGPPGQATVTENEMRYLVLLFGSIAVTTGFVVVERLLNEAGEHFYSSLGFAANILAGAAYLIWTSFQAGAYVQKVHDGMMSPAVLDMGNVFDVLLFAASVLTYVTTGAFAAAFGQAGWLKRGPARAYIITSLVALLLLGLRGISFPDPMAGATPWYTNLSFIVGIPAAPWIMPFFLGVVLLRRAGDAR